MRLVLGLILALLAGGGAAALLLSGAPLDPVILAAAIAGAGLAVASLGFLLARRWLTALLLLILGLVLAGGAYFLISTRVAAPPPTATSPLLLPGVKLWPSGDIPLCWLNRPAKGHESAEDLKDFAAVAAAETTWQKTGGVKFHDAGDCPADFKGVALLIRRAAGDADAPALGAAIADQAEPVTIPFAFDSRSGCAPGGHFGSVQTCITGETEHELGHVLGLPDIHYSAAAPPDCASILRGDHPSLPIPYDPRSVMNACYGDHLMGRLSLSDQEAARSLYGPPPGG